MVKIFKAIGNPKNINCDNEFASNLFKTYCNRHYDTVIGIVRYVSNFGLAMQMRLPLIQRTG